MTKISRRLLARYAADQLLGGKSAREVAERLAAVMSRTAQAGQVEFLLGDIAWELERRGELIVGRITTARPISKELESRLKQQIKKVSGAREVMVETDVDKFILGGVRIETPGRIWDATLAQKLKTLKEAV